MTKVACDPQFVSPQCRVRTTRSAAKRASVMVASLCLAVMSILPGCTEPTSTSSSSPATRATTSHSRATSQAASIIEARRQAFKIDHDAWNAIGYSIDWRGFPVVPEGEHIIFLNVYDDIVLAQESAATVSVLEASTGALRNSAQVANRLTRFVGNFRINNTAVISSDTEAFLMDLETGNVFERQSFSPRVVTTHPVYVDNQKIYGTAVGHVFSQYMKPAVEAWAFDLGSPIDVAPVLAGNTLAAISRRGDIAFLDPTSGTLLGKASIFGGCEAEPVASDSMVFFASLDQSIYGFSLSGKQIWRVRTEEPLHITPTYAAGVLYVPSDDKGLRAIDAATGIELWSQKKIAGRVIAKRNGNLLTWDGTTAATLDPATGDVITQVRLEGLSMLKADKFEDGNLYAVSTTGIIAKFIPWQ